MNESSLTRIKSHIENRNVGLISAFRGRYTKPENLQRTRELESMIRSDGFSFIKMNGHYIEGHGTPNAQDKDEVALFVIGKAGSKVEEQILMVHLFYSDGMPLPIQ